MMKVILYMAVTVNSLIAKENDDTSFVSKNSWEEYKRVIEESDCIIVGKRAYEIMPPQEFVKGKFYIVFTDKTNLEKKSSNIRFTTENPKSVLESLAQEGIKQVAICGGGTLNTSFMLENLIDEMYLDIEPIVLGKGIKLFAERDFEAELKLLGTKKLSDNEIQLHYQVLK